jgi:hypothetical protein
MMTRRPKAGTLGTIPRPSINAPMALDWDRAQGVLMVVRNPRGSSRSCMRFRFPDGTGSQLYYIGVSRFTPFTGASTRLGGFLDEIDEPPGVKVGS